MTLSAWCRDTAKAYRERAEYATYEPGEPWCLCALISAERRKGSCLDFGPLKGAIHKLPGDPRDPQWPLDDSGFDARAKFLEDFALTLEPPGV